MSTFSYSAKLYESDLQKGEICYEKAKKEHFDALFALYECSFPDKAPRLPFEYGVINELDTYIALIDGTPVGMVSANPVFYKGQKGHQIFKLCAHPKVRGRGIGGALLSFMHGAQDGQKFAAVLILGGALAGRETGKSFSVLLCGILMAAGTAIGGKRIIAKVSEITEIDQKGGLSCDIAAFISMLVCTLFGIPVSTTHSKTTAVLGVGFSKGTVNLRAWGGMAFAWVLTFPVCFLLSFFITKLCV